MSRAGHAIGAVRRKSIAALRQLPRGFRRITTKASHYSDNPPIVVNSLPKSGTHLLMQIAQALPETVYYGNFVAQIPSYSHKMRSNASLKKRIFNMVPGEVFGAHLYYNPVIKQAFDKINAVHLFIYRDLRDVVLSEAHYLAHMAPLHAMHHAFSELPDEEARVRLAILGDEKWNYPDCVSRSAPYFEWLDDTEVCAVRYEDLAQLQYQTREIDRIISAWEIQANCVAPEGIREHLLQSILPEKSHTFREGGVAKWKTKMSLQNKRLLEDLVASKADTASKFLMV